MPIVLNSEYQEFCLSTVELYPRVHHGVGDYEAILCVRWRYFALITLRVLEPWGDRIGLSEHVWVTRRASLRRFRVALSNLFWKKERL